MPQLAHGRRSPAGLGDDRSQMSRGSVQSPVTVHAHKRSFRTLEAPIGEGVTVLFFNGAEGDQSPTPRLTADTVGVLLAALCPATSHCTAVRVGDLTTVGVPGEMAAGLGLEVKAALRGRTGAKPVAIGGLADEWISYMLTPEEYRRGGYEASVSFYGEDLGPRGVRNAIASATAVW